jgi:copper chaperone CopZ
MAVTKALNEIKGIRNVNVDLSKGEASFEEEELIERTILEEKIKKAGYEVV